MDVDSRAAFRYSLPVLKIYSSIGLRNVHYRFSVIAVNIGKQP